MATRVGKIHYSRPAKAKTRIEKESTDSRRLWRKRWQLLWENSIDSQQFSPQMVSSVAGSFDRILLTMPDWLFSARAYNGVYKDFFKKLPKRLQYVIVIPRSKRQSLNRWIREYQLNRRVEVVPVSNELDFTVWAEDPYVMVQDNGTGESF